MAQSPRPQGFSTGTLKGFRGAFSPEPLKSGEPLLVGIDRIDVDPSQPRRSFPENELQALADSMLVQQGDGIVGVLSPIGVRRGEEGRWKLAFGERRLRAARMAGLKSIPVTIVSEGQSGLAAQVIENQHRTNLANSDLARVIAAWTAEGMSNDDIAKIANITEGTIKHYRVMGRLPSFLQPWCDNANPRAVYEIHQSWKRVGEEGKALIEARVAALNGEEGISLAEARRIVELPISKAPAKPIGEPSSRGPRLRAAEKIQRLTAVIVSLLELVREDSRQKAGDLVEVALAEAQVERPQTGEAPI
jgi:ParB/RepB/Spo0J family partition protein